jgi:hypothetical protein
MNSLGMQAVSPHGSGPARWAPAVAAPAGGGFHNTGEIILGFLVLGGLGYGVTRLRRGRRAAPRDDQRFRWEPPPEPPSPSGPPGGTTISPARTVSSGRPAGGWAVEARGLTKRFGANVAVDGVELQVPRGYTFGYLGPNGAGKTTLMRIVLGLTRADDKVASYSMGMRQRLGVACCLLGDPELLILDEPMNGLDPAGMHADRCRADRHLARGSLPRARRRHQPAAGRRGHPGIRPPGGPDVAGGLVLVRDEPAGRTVVTTTEPSLSGGRPGALVPGGRAAPAIGSWLPTWDLTTKNLEIRKRRGLMITVAVLIVASAVLIDGLRLLFHAVDPHGYGPAGDPGLFSQLTNLMAEFGFIAAAALGAAAGTTDLSDGMFRHLVITGRSRLALYLARIPAGLAITVPLVALAFMMSCLVTSYESAPPPTSVGMYGLTLPEHLDQAELQTWLLDRPQQVATSGLPTPGLPVGPATTPAQIRSAIDKNIATYYRQYTADEISGQSPADNEMAKIGLWLELEVGIGFLAGLGLGPLTGQRTTTTIGLIALEIIVAPLLARTQIPYVIDGQRLLIGVAMDQLRPAGLASANSAGGLGQPLSGGQGTLGVPPMPTWAMISVIAGWIIGWSVIGAWQMMTRDA